MKLTTPLVLLAAGVVMAGGIALVAVWTDHDGAPGDESSRGESGTLIEDGQHAVRDGMTRSPVSDGEGDGGIRSPRTARLEQVVGHVHDLESGRPVGGARIYWEDRFSVADEEGRFDLGRWIPQREAGGRLQAVHPDYADTWLSVEAAPLTEEGIRVPMVRGVTVEGSVRDLFGQPISNARVVATGPDGSAAWPKRARQELEESPYLAFESSRAVSNAKTDDSGNYRISSILASADGIEVVASGGGYVADRKRLTDLDVGGRVVLDFALDRGARVVGKVTVNGATVRGRVSWMTDDARGSAGIHSQGRYELRGLPSGTALIRAMPECGVMAAREKRIEVQAGADLVVDFTIVEPTRIIGGRVTNEYGKALGNAFVAAQGPDETLVRGRCDAGGHYELALCARPGTKFRVHGYHESSSASLDDVAVGTTDADLVIPTMGVVRLHVLDAVSGRPVVGFDVRIRRPGEKDFGSKLDLHDVDGEGRAWFRAPSECLEILVRAARMGFSDEHVVDVLPGDERDVEVRTVLMHRGTSLTINWVGDLSRVTPKRRVLILLTEEQAGALEIEVAETAEGAPLEGCIWNADFSLATNAPVDFVLDSRRLLEVHPKSRSRVQGLAAGTYRLKLWPDDLVLIPDEIRVSGTQEHEVDVRFRSRSESVEVESR